MQLPNGSTPIAKCEDLSLFTTGMLLKFPENAALGALGAKLAAATEAFTTAHAAYQSASKALVSARVAIVHADVMADKGVRLTLRAAELADGQPRGRIAAQLFPSGVTPIVKPIGAMEVAELRDLEGRLAAVASSWPGAAAEQAKLSALRTQYEAALEARRAGLQQVSDLGAKRAAAREDFLDVYAAIAGRVRAEFPRDPAMQEMSFEKVRADAGGAIDAPEPAPPPAPAA